MNVCSMLGTILNTTHALYFFIVTNTMKKQAQKNLLIQEHIVELGSEPSLLCLE